MFSESNATHPVRCFCPLQKVMALAHFLKNLNLLGRVCQPAADCISCLAQFVDGAPPKSLLNLLYFFTFNFSFFNEPRFVFTF